MHKRTKRTNRVQVDGIDKASEVCKERKGTIERRGD
jgi:NADH:ubiquinone oxidoreductase subunit